MEEPLVERNALEAWYEGRRARPGDLVTRCMYTDRDVYEVVAVSKSGAMLSLYPVEAVLLNGFNSGEPDALVSHPGGFAHHVEGQQRYRYELAPESERHPERVSKAHWARRRGSYQAPGRNRLVPGAHKHYDYNF